MLVEIVGKRESLRRCSCQVHIEHSGSHYVARFDQLLHARLMLLTIMLSIKTL